MSEKEYVYQRISVSQVVQLVLFVAVLATVGAFVVATTASIPDLVGSALEK